MAKDSGKYFGTRLLIAVNTAEFFLSHRLHLAQGARDAGWDVWVLCPPSPIVAKIKALGFSVAEIAIGRKSMNPFFELATLWRMYVAIRAIQPQVYHGFTVKPVLYGTLICRLLKIPKIFNTITGLGFLFLSQSKAIVLVREAVGLFYKILFSSDRVRVIFQNEDDQNYFAAKGWIHREKSRVIKGTGVDIQRFQMEPEPEGPPVIVFPARLLFDKGVSEFVGAAELLIKKGYQLTFELCGKEDPGNPSSLSSEAIKNLQSKSALFKIRGHVEDMALAFRNCHIVCLPSYREGIPLALLEASACGRPIVTTDVPGCRAVIDDGVEGFLVPSKNSELLAIALEKLLQSKDLRILMGRRARERAVREFAKESVVAKNLFLYGPPPQPNVIASVS
jgi:glycosyltransferase involved in cell wall biosynthesis